MTEGNLTLKKGGETKRAKQGKSLYRQQKHKKRKALGEREERKKVRQGDGKCSGEKGYLCLGVVGTAGRLLKGSQV